MDCLFALKKTGKTPLNQLMLWIEMLIEKNRL
jgi:hypothetical protein